jgi:acyl-CoA thioesterase FadM
MRNRKITIPSPFCFQTELTVQVSDINYGGHVGNERYLLFAQETRMRFLQNIGCSEMHFGPFGLALTEAHVEYFYELFHGNTIHISLAIGTPSRASFDCFYSIKLLKDGSEIESATIKTSMVCFDYKERKVRSIPDELRKILEQCANGTQRV